MPAEAAEVVVEVVDDDEDDVGLFGLDGGVCWGEVGEEEGEDDYGF